MSNVKIEVFDLLQKIKKITPSQDHIMVSINNDFGSYGKVNKKHFSRHRINLFDKIYKRDPNYVSVFQKDGDTICFASIKMEVIQREQIFVCALKSLGISQEFNLDNRLRLSNKKVLENKGFKTII